jgi:hypothetical protein
MTRLKPTLTEVERKKTADKLWKIINMIDIGCHPGAIREGVKLIAHDIEPFGAEYEEEKST